MNENEMCNYAPKVLFAAPKGVSKWLGQIASLETQYKVLTVAGDGSKRHGGRNGSTNVMSERNTLPVM